MLTSCETIARDPDLMPTLLWPMDPMCIPPVLLVLFPLFVMKDFHCTENLKEQYNENYDS